MPAYLDADDQEDHHKYLDLQLYGPNDVEVIPVRVDHWDAILDGTITEPDRNLIAAAPDLYEALKKQMCDCFDEYSERRPDAPCSRCRAIAKAEGRS